MSVVESAPSFKSVSETPGGGASPEALNMLRTRYHYAGELVSGKDAAEVACAMGMGLGYLLKRAKSLQAGDIDPEMISAANSHYKGRIEVRPMDAQNLPFADASLDALLMLEAIYFLPDAGKFLDEAKRVLRPGGALMVASPNPRFESFNPAPKSTRYFRPDEIRAEFVQRGFGTEILIGFPEDHSGLKSKVLNLVRKVAVALRLIPDTMEGKERIKRLIYGKLPPFPSELDETTGEVCPFEPLDEAKLPIEQYKVYYAIGRLA